MIRLNFKRFFKRLAIALAVTIAVLAIADAVFIQVTGARLENRLEALRKAGEPLSIAEMARAPIPPESNAETFLRRADDDLKAIQMELEVTYPRMGFPESTPTPAEREKLQKLFDAHPGLLPALEQAASAPDYVPPLDATLPRDQFLNALLDLSTKHRPLYSVLRARSALQLAQGRPDDAAATDLLLLRLSRQFRHEPMFIGYLVAAVGKFVAIEALNDILQAGPVSEATRRAIDEELARHDTMDGFAEAIRTERAFTLSTAAANRWANFWPLLGFSNDLKLRLLDLYDRYQAQASRPFLQIAAERRPALRPRITPDLFGALVTLLEPGLLSAMEAGNRVRAMTRSLRVLNAIQQHAPADSDEPPPLDSLGLPAETTTDPFDGRPLRVKKTDRGWTVYSVGGNGLDDGGLFQRAADVGVGPVESAGDRTTARPPRKTDATPDQHR